MVSALLRFVDLESIVRPNLGLTVPVTPPPSKKASRQAPLVLVDRRQHVRSVFDCSARLNGGGQGLKVGGDD